MKNDPLAEYRKKPLSAMPELTQESDEYVAFAGRDNIPFLEIRRTKDPARSPRYDYLLDVSYDDAQGTNFVLYYTFMIVTVQGRNLREVVYAVQHSMARFIQEYDKARWPTLTDEKAPVIDSIEVIVTGAKIDPNDRTRSH